MTYLPRRAIRTTSYRSDLNWSVAGIALGFAICGLMLLPAMELEMAFSPPHFSNRDHGLADIVTGILTMSITMAAYGTGIALIPMMAVMMVERITRTDLGLLAWTTIGLAPTALLGSIMAGSASGGVAMASGGIAGMMAHTMKRMSAREGATRWEIVSAIGMALIAAMSMLSLSLTPIES